MLFPVELFFQLILSYLTLRLLIFSKFNAQKHRFVFVLFIKTIIEPNASFDGPDLIRGKS